jgi:O-antigen/teichoic acid export membrane protein
LIIGISGLDFGNKLFRNVLLIYGAVLFSQAININWYYRTKGKTIPIAVGQIVSSAISLLLVVILMKKNTEPLYAIIIITVKEVINSLILLILYTNRGQLIKIDFDFIFIKDVFKKSQPLFISAIFILINANVDQFLLGVLTDTYEVGIYSAAYKIILLSLIPATIILQSFFPEMSKQRTQFHQKEIVYNSHNLMFLVGSTVTIFCFLFSEEIILIVYGNNYSLSIKLFHFLSLSIIFIYASKMYCYHLVAIDKQKYFMISILVGSMVNVVLNLFLIPHYFAKGAVIATLISELTILLGSLFFYKKIFSGLNKKIVIALPLIVTVILISELFFVGLISRILLFAVTVLGMVKLIPVRLVI